MIELILNAGAIFLIYILLVTCINLFMYILFYRDRDLIEIKLPVRKKFKTSRLSPLYKLTKTEFSGSWYINKYEVRWGINENSMFYTVTFIPFLLINWETYKTSDFLIVLRKTNRKWFEFYKPNYQVFISANKYDITDYNKCFFIPINKWIGDSNYNKNDLVMLNLPHIC